MLDIELTIKGEKYKKNVPKLKDYVALIDYNEKYYGKSFVNTKEAVIDAFDFIAAWFGNEITAQDIDDNYDLNEVMTIFQNIESNTFEVFTGVPLKRVMEKSQKAQSESKRKK